MSLLWITNAVYVTDYKIKIDFNTNESGIVDFENMLNKKIFEPLKEKKIFKDFRLNSWTIEWENGADFSPEFLLNEIMKTN
jgi:hypothetical protein